MEINNFNTPLSLEIKSSFHKYLIIIAPHVFAISLLIFIISLPLLTTLVLIATVVFSLTYFLQLHCLNALNHSIITIKQDSLNNWMILFTNESEMKAAHLMASSFTSNHFIILIYKIDNAYYFQKKACVIITKDSLPKQKFRLLKSKLLVQHLT